jgi:arylsulfatase A-like enzyme
MMFTTFFVDFVSHRYWRYFQPELFGEDPSRDDRLTSALADAYEAVDRGFARLLAAVPEETVVAVVSEHGMEAEPASGEVGRWRYVLRGSRIAALVGLGDELRSRPVARWVAFHPQTQRRLPTDASERLRQVMIVETQRPLFDVYDHGDEVVIKLAVGGSGSRYGDGDLESLHISYADTSIPFRAIATRAGRQRSAMHARDGILVLAGPGLRRSETVSQPAHLTDFAPTLHAAAGLPVQNHLSGRVLDVFN